jgi:uncharacterized protein (TIGR02757 family)
LNYLRNTASAIGILESLYDELNRLDYLSPDPLEVVLGFSSREDRETAALIAALFALGRADLIVSFLRTLFADLGSPYRVLVDATAEDLGELLSPRVYRFFSHERILALLSAVGGVLRRFGSLEAAAAVPSPGGSRRAGLAGLLAGPEGALYALDNLRGHLASQIPDAPRLLPGIVFPAVLPGEPLRGGAAKRLMLFLRWMVRKDAVDPGGWSILHPHQLFYPLDTHMMDLSGSMGIRRRRSADMAAAREITGWFRRLNQEDPVKYDFALTRLGIRSDLSKDSFITTFKSASKHE